uniref:PDZ domain-containing protein n=1 Tax=Anopheles culicifacies TaxID=139723 RepID=A0A182LRP4_9DIPT
MKINASKMATPIEEKVDQNLKTRTGMVMISDGKSKPELARLHLSMEMITIQKQDTTTPAPTPTNATHPPIESKERMVQITRQKVGGLGLSIKGGAEHKLPILISRIYKDQAADATGQLFVGDAIIKVSTVLPGVSSCRCRRRQSLSHRGDLGSYFFYRALLKSRCGVVSVEYPREGTC